MIGLQRLLLASMFVSSAAHAQEERNDDLSADIRKIHGSLRSVAQLYDDKRCEEDIRKDTIKINQLYLDIQNFQAALFTELIGEEEKDIFAYLAPHKDTLCKKPDIMNAAPLHVMVMRARKSGYALPYIAMVLNLTVDDMGTYLLGFTNATNREYRTRSKERLLPLQRSLLRLGATPVSVRYRSVIGKSCSEWAEKLKREEVPMIHNALADADNDLVQLLLAHGADNQLRNLSIRTRHDGYAYKKPVRPLVHALVCGAHSGNFAVMETLLKQGYGMGGRNPVLIEFLEVAEREEYEQTYVQVGVKKAREYNIPVWQLHEVKRMVENQHPGEWEAVLCLIDRAITDSVSRASL